MSDALRPPREEDARAVAQLTRRILGVRRSSRGRGLGRALLLHAFAQFRRHGMTRVGLGMDGENPTGANKLYETAGMQVSARFAIYEKVVA